MMILDVKRAFLYGDIEDKIYIELPEEDTMKSKGYVGLLKKAMYGTRAAPQVWQEVVRKKMVSLDFVPSIKFPCVYFHKVKNLKVVTHVDDFLATGKKSDLGWLKEKLQEDFELKGTILGPGTDEAKEDKYLGRTIRWKEHGIEYEGDGKHAQILLQEWQLQDSKAVGSPGVPEEKKLDMNNEEQTLVNGTRAKAFRRGAARINYMSLDRMDLSFASNSTSKGMANPTEADEMRLKRTIRYIKGRPTAKILYKWQERPTEAVAYTDSDWAGCQKTRRSTSGGIIMLGCHAIQHWTSTQHNVANSSGEAELNALNKAVSEVIGVTDLMSDCGVNVDATVKTDSSAANGIVHRRGCGKLKHLETRQLWAQEKVLSKRVRSVKVPRELNIADCFTHHWSPQEGGKFFPMMNLDF